MRWNWLAVGGWMTVVLLNSSVPAAPLAADALLVVIVSKAAHVMEYLIFGYLAWRALVVSGDALRLRPGACAAMVLMGGLLFASLDELRQFFVSGRAASPLDVLIDGVALSGLSATQLRRARDQMREPG